MEMLLESLYSGIVNARDWDIFCHELAKVLNADFAIILSMNPQTNEQKYAASFGYSKENQEKLLKFLPDDDPRVNIAKTHYDISHSFSISESDPIDNKLLSLSQIHKEIFSPNSIEHHLVLGITIDHDEDLFIIVERKWGKEAFQIEDRNILNSIKEHISRAVKLQKKHASNDKYIRAGLNSLKQQPVGSILANSNGRIFYLNDYAKSIIDKKEGLFIVNEHLYYGNAKSAKLLSDVLDLTLNTDQDHLENLTKENSKKAYQINVRPFNTRSAPFQSQYESENMVQIIIIDPDKPLTLNAPLLENIFGLTASEAKVASSLTKNCNLKATQDELNISANTARTHLKHIFNKMNVTSQVELVKLIITSYLWTSEK